MVLFLALARRARPRRTARRRRPGAGGVRPALLVGLTVLVAAPSRPTAAQSAADLREAHQPGRVSGTIVDRETRHPIEGVAVTLRMMDGGAGESSAATAQPVLTDASGRFEMLGLADGRYRIVAERIGYQRAAASLELRAQVGARIAVEMVREAVELEPLVVVAEAGSRYLESAGFYDRARRGIGQFVTRDELLAGNVQRVSDVFRTMPGVRVSRGGGAGGSNGYVLLRRGCPADVYMDGMRLMPPVSIDALVRPPDVEAVEVYQGSEVPARYRTTNCGAVLIWTHVPNPGVPASPLTWRRVLAVVGFAAFAIVIAR